MELHWFCLSSATLLLACYVFVYKFVRNLNGWYYDIKLQKKQCPLPPGDMGWPLIGNLLPFFKDFSSGHPNSFINNLVLRYGRTGVYKTHLFGKPSIIVCEPEMCRRVLTDDLNFKLGYPKSTRELAQSRPMYDVSGAEHKSFRRLITSPMMGHNVLAMYLERIENIVIDSLEKLSSMKHPVELLKEMKNISFKVILHVFIGSNNDNVVKKIGNLFDDMFNGVFSIPINAPGFVFHKALEARKKLAKVIQPIVEERRFLMTKNDGQVEKKKDLIDTLLEIKDEKAKLGDEDIIDLLLGLLFAGHESSATTMMWSITYLTQFPHMLKKAKEEQEEIVRTRSPSQTRLSMKEIKKMVYLSHVIDETLRCVNIAFATFREATADVYNNGYIIPKGWRVLIWIRALHMDPAYYTNPEEFNPSRWDDCNAKAGSFIPFGAGSRLCPGSDLAKIEISVFLHYFLLNYKLEQINPECPTTCLPVTKPTNNCLAKVIKVS